MKYYKDKSLKKGDIEMIEYNPDTSKIIRIEKSTSDHGDYYTISNDTINFSSYFQENDFVPIRKQTFINNYKFIINNLKIKK